MQKVKNVILDHGRYMKLLTFILGFITAITFPYVFAQETSQTQEPIIEVPIVTIDEKVERLSLEINEKLPSIDRKVVVSDSRLDEILNTVYRIETLLKNKK